MAEIPKYQFKSVQLLKDQSLGVGSYGAVCKAKCDDLLCAAKIIHPTLFDPTALQQVAPQREHRLPIRRFEQECEFMSAIRHPNIVQYLGMFRDTDTRLPVLLMELMDDSLTHFLESSTQPIPYHIQINICHDVSLALSFLHSNKIVHRDLSSNNVLLRGNILAKVTDFGMARLGDINPQATRLTSTMCPGTDVYMPPEAVQDKPVYTEKIDCFSFGVIIVQTLTRQFPKPGDRLQEIELSHPGIRAGTVLVRIPEVERQQNHIGQVDPNHSLLPIALDCLKDKRPSAHQLCERVADLKGMPTYRDSARAVEDSRDEVIRSQATCMEEKDRTIPSKEEEIQQMRQQLQEKDRHLKQLQQERDQANRQLQQESDQNLQKERQLQEKQRQLGRVNQQLEASEQVVAQFERRIAELEQQLSQREQQKIKASNREKELTSFKLTWREGKRMPHEIPRLCDAVVDGNKMYIMDGGLKKIHSYNVTSDSWCQLPDCVLTYCPLAIIDGLLTTIGGCHPDLYYNVLFSLTGEGSGRRWTKIFPPMPTKRMCAAAVCSRSMLIVVGGMSDEVLSTVEVMNIEHHQWSTAASLPEPMFHTSLAVCGEQIYMLGGVNKYRSNPKSVYTSSVSALLQSCSLEANFKRASLVDKHSDCVWRRIADLPVIHSTCQSFRGRLLAIGGNMDLGECTTAVYMYHSPTNSWEIASHMKTGRYCCFAAVLPDNELIVVAGGCDSNTVEVASVI